TFFYRHMRDLIRNGCVFLAQPPLYKIEIGKDTFWALDDVDRARILKEHAKGNAKPNIMRFKGLGEMTAEELKSTTLDPRRRRAHVRRARERAAGSHRCEAYAGRARSRRVRRAVESSRAPDRRPRPPLPRTLHLTARSRAPRGCPRRRRPPGSCMPLCSSMNSSQGANVQHIGFHSRSL